ncbi:MAG: PDZ domain-containing protein [Methylotenera sp.]|nr:PDZ domain-containing protein [Methylotenera sp.]
MLLTFLFLGTLFFAHNLYAADNPYEKNYRVQNGSNLKSLSTSPDTKMYVSNHKDKDNISMLENGYDMMGTSGFDGTDTSSDLALQFGKSINADTVLVYSKYGSAKTSASKLQLIKEAAKRGGGIDAKDLEEPATEYQYYASYWAKLPTPLLGVHLIKLKPVVAPESDVKPVDEKGLNIIAVIKESPAAKAGIIKGDVLLKLGDVELNKPDDLFLAVKRYEGETVQVELMRDQSNITVTVALNSRK